MDPTPLPSPFTLLQQSIDALSKNPVGFLLAGLGVIVVVIPMTLLMLLGTYALLLVGMLPGLMMENQALMSLGLLATFFTCVLAILALSTSVTAPLYASILRAVDTSQRGEGALGMGSAFGTVSQDIGRVVGVYALTSTVALIGAMMCYLPGIIVAFFVSFAIPGVVIHRLSPVDAIRRSVHHVQQDLGWHVQVFLIYFAIMAVLSQVPLVGLAVAVPLGLDFQLRAYRAAFADPS